MVDDSAASPFSALPVGVLRDNDLSFTARLLYADLLVYARQTGVCWPSQERLAEDLGTSVSTIKRALGELMVAGLVTSERKNRHRGCTYRLTSDRSPMTPQPDPDSSPVDARQVSSDPSDSSPVTHRSRSTEVEATSRSIGGVAAVTPSTASPQIQTEEPVVERSARPVPMTTDWQPDPLVLTSLKAECEKAGVNLFRSIRRFRGYYFEKGMTSRCWDAKLEQWVLRDIDNREQTHPSHVLDEMGMATWQRKPHPRGLSEAEQQELESLASIIEAEKERARATR